MKRQDRAPLLVAFALGCLLSAFTTYSWAQAPRAECVTAAKQAYEAASKTPKKPTGPGCFVDAQRRVTPIAGEGECTLDGPGVFYFEQPAHTPAFANENLGVSTLNVAADCDPLYSVTRAAAAAASEANGKESPNQALPRAVISTLEGPGARNASDILTEYKASPNSFVLKTPPGAIGTGALGDAVNETVQILGQIVVDRASQAGYRLASKKIREGLGCPEDDQSSSKTPFPATCAALLTLRIQELATSQQALTRALVSDVMAAAFREASASTGVPEEVVRAAASAMQSGKLDTDKLSLVLEQARRLGQTGSLDAARALLEQAGVDQKEVPELLKPAPTDKNVRQFLRLIVSITTSTLLEALSTGSQRRSVLAAQAAVAELRSSAIAMASQGGQKDARFAPLILASAALVKCQAQAIRAAHAQGTHGNAQALLASCDISAEVDLLLDGAEPRVGEIARSVARAMQAALSPSSEQDTSVDDRVLAILDGSFDMACHAVAPNKELGCPPLLDVAVADRDKIVIPLAAARGVLLAMLQHDSNRAIATLSAALELIPRFADQGGRSSRRRALRLVGAVLQYAGTYAAKDASAEALHDQRTKILESLTEEMTNRTGREGDWIFSLGGSLALTAGKRWPAPGGDGEAVFNGPFQLTLGAALQNVPSGDGPGWHFEAGVLDLAQYLSFQSEPGSGTENERSIEVREPELQDALAPSLKFGLQCGRDVPVYAAVMGQYVPFYEFIEDDGAVDRHGALVVGVSLGAYVPLIDAN